MLDALYLLATLENSRPHLATPGIIDVATHVGFARRAFTQHGAHGGLGDLGPPPPPPPGGDPSVNAGAAFPITYNGTDAGSGITSVVSLGGTARYVKVGGPNTTGCTDAANPCATITQAYNAATAGDPVILRSGGGVFRNFGSTWNGSTWTAELSWNKAGSELYAYPNESPIVDGSLDITANTWTAADSSTHEWVAYTPFPCAVGTPFGINFCTEGTYDNLNGTSTTSPYNVGKWNDALWVDDVQYQQVVRKADLATLKFWVDRTETVVGTASASSGGNTLTGTSSNFSVLLNAGDSITVAGQTKTVSTITSNTVLTITGAFSPAISGGTVTRNGNNRLYMMKADNDAAAKIEASDKGDIVTVNTANFKMAGIQFRRFSAIQTRAAAIDINSGGDNAEFYNVELKDIAAAALYLGGNAPGVDALNNVRLDNVTFDHMNWLATNLTFNQTPTIFEVVCQNTDQWNEFASSPLSGCMKTSRVWHLSLLNSRFLNNKSQSFWGDESNYDWLVAGTSIINNGVAGEDTCFFFEISDKLKFVNNFIKCPNSINFKIAASTGIDAINNTFVGGTDVFGVYADVRSHAGCSTNDPVPAGTSNFFGNDGITCGLEYASNQWTTAKYGAIAAHPDTMDWLPRIDRFQNNIIVYANTNSAGYCGVKTVVCINRINAAASVTLPSIIHVAEPGRGIPQTVWDCNVYAANGTSLIMVRHPTTTAFNTYSSASAFGTAMGAASPYPAISGIDAHSLTGVAYDLVLADGTPTAALTDPTDAACAFPTDAAMNAHVAAGTKHFGVTWQ